MHSPNTRTWIPIAVLLAASLAAARPADADRAKDKAKNRISAVGFDAAGQETTIQIRGSTTPTFTVYKLDRPTRVVVDIAGATLADQVKEAQENGATMAIGTWAVNQLAAYELDDGGKLVRVVVTLARPGRYDVKADGTNVVVSVIARDAAPEVPDAADVEAAQAAAQKAKQDSEAAGAARVKAEQAAAKAKAQADTSKQEADAAKRALAEAQDAAARADKTSKAERARADRALADAKAEAERTKKAAAEAKAEHDRTRKAAEDAEARAEKTRRVAERAKAELETMKQELAAAKADAKRHEQEAAAAKADASAQRQKAGAAEKAAAQDKQAAAAAKADAQRLEDEAAKARAEAQRARAEAEAAQKAAADAKAQADAAKAQAAAAKKEAAASKRDAAAARETAAADKRDAQAMRAEAERMLGESRARLKEAEAEARAAKKSQEAAVAARGKAEKKEEAARGAEAKAAAERKAAEQALAAAEKARAAGDDDAERRIADAEARLAKAEKARATAEDQRKTAEASAEEARALAARRKAQTDDAVAAKAAAERDKQAAAKAAGEAEARATRAEALRKEEDAAAKAAAEAKAAVAAAEKAKASKTEIDAKRAEAKRLKKDADQARQAREQEETQLAAIVAERRVVEADLADARKAADAARKDAAAAEKRAAQARRDAEAAEARAKVARDDAEAAKREAKAARTAKAEPEPAAKKPAAKPAPAPAPAPKKPPAIAVEDVTFQQDGDESRVIVAMSGEIEPEVRASGSRVEMTLAGVDLPKKLERKLDVSKFAGAVRSVSSYRDSKDPSKVRVVVELDAAITPRVERTGNTLRMSFADTGAVAKKAAKPKAAPRARAGVKTESIPAPVVGGYGASSAPVTSKSVAQSSGARRKVYRGPTIDLDFKDADIHNLLRFLANIGRVSIVVPDDIKATVTVRLKRVPWDQALEVILASKGLWYRKEGNLYRIAPRKVLDAEDQAEAERIRASVQSEVPEAEVFTLNYTSAEEIQQKLAPLLSPKGKIEVDPRTNSLIINDIRAHRRRVIDLADRLDIQTPQIMIEARIVEARSTYARDIGIQWGGSANASQAGGNATGLIFPNSIGVAGGNEDNQTPSGGVATPSDFAINLPAATGTGAGAAIGVSLGSVGGNFNLNLRLSALEDTGTVRIISSPKITVLNNAQAEISQGQSIPISVVSAQGTQTQFVPAELRLTVTPYVSQRDCSIAMNVEVTKNEPDFVNTGARGDPTILTKEARTRILVADGETTVLGGITTRNTGLSYNKVPFFGDLPVVGWFFKRRRENDDRTELLIFITPRITNKAFLRCE